jgi:S-adenosylmethionine:tRNA ribosyltransferase-isomerase
MGRGALEMIAWSSPTSGVMRRACAHAIDSGYRFYSYGDACLLFRATSPHV